MRPSVSYMRFCAHICSHFHSSSSRAEIKEHKQRYKRVMSKLPALERDMVIFQDNGDMLDRIIKFVSVPSLCPASILTLLLRI